MRVAMIEAVVIGVSAGGMKALSALLPQVPENPGFAVIVVQHLQDGSANSTGSGKSSKRKSKNASWPRSGTRSSSANCRKHSIKYRH